MNSGETTFRWHSKVVMECYEVFSIRRKRDVLDSQLRWQFDHITNRTQVTNNRDARFEPRSGESAVRREGNCCRRPRFGLRYRLKLLVSNVVGDHHRGSYSRDREHHKRLYERYGRNATRSKMETKTPAPITH